MLRMRLEASGITAFVQDEATFSLGPQYTAGLVRLQISELDLEAAQAVLGEPTLPESPESPGQ